MGKMAEEKKGIKELSELAEFVCELGNAMGKALEDGKLSLGDALLFVKAALAAPKALIGISEVEAEFFDLDASEKQILHDLVMAKLDLPQETAEGIVESVINVAIEMSDALKAIVEAKKPA